VSENIGQNKNGRFDMAVKGFSVILVVIALLTYRQNTQIYKNEVTLSTLNEVRKFLLLFSEERFDLFELILYDPDIFKQIDCIMKSDDSNYIMIQKNKVLDFEQALKYLAPKIKSIWACGSPGEKQASREVSLFLRNFLYRYMNEIELKLTMRTLGIIDKSLFDSQVKPIFDRKDNLKQLMEKANWSKETYPSIDEFVNESNPEEIYHANRIEFKELRCGFLWEWIKRLFLPFILPPAIGVGVIIATLIIARKYFVMQSRYGLISRRLQRMHGISLLQDKQNTYSFNPQLINTYFDRLPVTDPKKDQLTPNEIMRTIIRESVNTTKNLIKSIESYMYLFHDKSAFDIEKYHREYHSARNDFNDLTEKMQDPKIIVQDSEAEQGFKIYLGSLENIRNSLFKAGEG
jgi:hypothetical protein